MGYMDNIGVRVEGDKKQSFTSLLHELQVIVNDTINIVIDHCKKNPVEVSNWVAVIILKRIIEAARESAWRIAVESWLRSKGYIKVHINQKCHPVLPSF